VSLATSAEAGSAGPPPGAGKALAGNAAASPVKSFLSALKPPPELADLASWGWKTAAGLSDAADELVRPIIAALEPSIVSVYAVGGYGRRELMPFSDVDLLIVTRKEVDLAPIHAQLWNLGIKPSILVRASKTLKESAKEDLKFATTLLDHRLLHGAGEPLLTEDMRWIAKVRKKFVEEQKDAAAERHAQYRGAGCQEPNLREGRGGLRDLQMRPWFAAIEQSPRPLRAAFDPAAHAAYGTLLAARFIIHHVSIRREDRMLLVDRDGIIEWLKWPEHDVFFQAVCLAMKRTALARPPSPPAPLSVRELLDRLAATPLRHEPTSVSATPQPPILTPRRPIAPALRAWDATGELGTVIPDWTRIEGLVRNDPAHWYTPDEHTLRVVEKLEAVLERGHRSLDLSQVSRPDLLILAAIFHDLGKGTGRDHAEAGTELVRDTLRGWGFASEDVEKVAFLVAQHQLLTHNAFMRDIDDYNLIHELARRIHSTENLAMLYALTVADLRAVSDDLFTDWKGELLATLTTRLRRQCSYYLPPRRIGREGLRRRKDQVRRLMGPDFEFSIERHFSRIDARYALAHTPEQIAHHIRLLPRLRDEPIVLDRHSVPERAFTEITILTKSHHGLFAEIAGTLSAKGLNILAADIATRTDDLAIDSFKVSENRDASLLDDDRWKNLERDLRRVISGEVAIADFIEARKAYARPLSPIRKAVSVHFDNETSPTHTVVEVTAPDEIGLLYRIASVFRDCGVGITSAIVTTEGDLGVDIFYVTSASGAKITDKDTMARIEEGFTEQATGQPMPKSAPLGTDIRVEGGPSSHPGAARSGEPSKA
jgi:UTP:GlnB (protein PII) uridylyltransferase